MRPQDLGRLALPEALRALREARGVSQDVWAGLCFVSRRTVQRWENGEAVPDEAAEQLLITHCRERGLFVSTDHGWRGFGVTELLLRDLIAEARASDALERMGGPPSFAKLWALARPSPRLWPEPADRRRGLGAIPRRFSLGSRLCLAIEVDRPCYLVLLDKGTEGEVFCLCPSWFALEMRLDPGITYLPQAGSRYPELVLTGVPGQEQLLAILTEDPLSLPWIPADDWTPARTLRELDFGILHAELAKLRGRWYALATTFEVQ